MVGDLALIPRAAVLDPLLTVGMPPRVTAASGMDALCHAVEAFIGRSNTRTTRQNAIAAVRLIFADLERAYRDGGDLEARFGMQQAAYRAGLAFTRANVGYVHAVAHALGGRYGIAHGACCAVAMPAVLRAYGEKAHVALAALADAAGVTQGSASAQQTSNKAEALIRAIESLNRKLGLPETFAQIRRRIFRRWPRRRPRRAICSTRRPKYSAKPSSPTCSYACRNPKRRKGPYSIPF
jgi:alcohol dehydrogenase class IV